MEKIPTWLQDLERTSWQIEVLISGGLIYTLYNFPTIINEALLGAFLHTEFNTALLVVFIACFIVSKALLIGFGINLFLRAIWLALLGVHFAYPKGIDYDRLNYSQTFEQEMKKRRGTLQRVLWLEKWASLTYSMAIILAVAALGAVLMVALFYYLLFDPWLPEEWATSEAFGYIFLFIISIISFGFLDKLMFRTLRNRPKAGKRYFKISQVIGTLNLTRFFRRESLTIVSNNRRWKIHLINLCYFIIAIFISLQDLELESPLKLQFSLFDSRDYKELPAYSFWFDDDEYDDLLKPGQLVEEASIPSEVIHGSTLPVFITYDKIYDRSFDYLADSIGLRAEINDREELLDNTKLVQEALSLVFHLYLDGEYVDSLRWFSREHPITNQVGFYTRLPIDTLAVAERHDLVVSYLPIYRTRADTINMRWIPFWREE